MTEPDELLGKADALLARYRTSIQSDFPVLTDIVDPVPAVNGNKSPAGSPAAGREPETGPSEPIDLEIQALETRLRQQILEALEPRIQALLENRLAGQINDHVSPALAKVCSDISDSIHASLKETLVKAVAEAVQTELAEIRSRLIKT